MVRFRRAVTSIVTLALLSAGPGAASTTMGPPFESGSHTASCGGMDVGSPCVATADVDAVAGWGMVSASLTTPADGALPTVRNAAANTAFVLTDTPDGPVSYRHYRVTLKVNRASANVRAGFPPLPVPGSAAVSARLTASQPSPGCFAYDARTITHATQIPSVTDKVLVLSAVMESSEEPCPAEPIQLTLSIEGAASLVFFSNGSLDFHADVTVVGVELV